MENLTIQEQFIQLRRNAILDAAVTVIAERGFERTTIKQIAQQAGVADGTIYNYFKNKAAIMTAIVERMTVAERRDIDFAQAEQADFATFVRDYVPLRLREMEAEMPALKVVLAETFNNAAFRDETNQTVYAPLFAIAERYMQSLIDRGELPLDDAAMATRLVASPLFGLLMLRLMGDQFVTENWQRCGELMVEMMLSMVDNQ